MNPRTFIARRRYSFKWPVAIAILVCLAVWFLAACTSAPPRELTLLWVLSPNPAFTCASMRLPYRDGGCVVSYGDRCTIVTAAVAVQFAQLGKQFRGCVE